MQVTFELPIKVRRNIAYTYYNTSKDTVCDELMELFGFTQPSCNRRMKQLMEEFRYIKKIEYNPTYNFYNDKYKAGLKEY